MRLLPLEALNFLLKFENKIEKGEYIMPQLTVKGMKIDELCKISKELTDKLEIAATVKESI